MCYGFSSLTYYCCPRNRPSGQAISRYEQPMDELFSEKNSVAVPLLVYSVYYSHHPQPSAISHGCADPSRAASQPCACTLLTETR